MTFKTLATKIDGKVALIQLNRPDALNALNHEMVFELNAALAAYEADPGIGCIVLTGSDKAFAAGADIKEMLSKTYIEAYLSDFIASWENIARCRKPIIAAVAGFALGGGCELAMMCDFIIAADTAKFGQPEIKLGVTPGAGATQRLTRIIGKSKAMDLCLTGRMMGAAEAEQSGLVARVTPADKLLETALAAAQTIAGWSMPAAMMTKEAINRAYETTLSEGVRFERRIFYSMFDLKDKTEGMQAFIEKRRPNFRNC